jgi:signal transduction histidine kinase
MRAICACIALAVLLSTTLGAALAQEPKRVLLLFSFGRDFKPWSEYAKAIRTELEQRSPWPLDLTDHSLVTARFGDDSTEPAFVQYLDSLYRTHPPDLIVAIGAPAAGFIQQNRQKLFPKSPMILTAIDQRRVQFSTLTANDTAVTVHINLLAAMENILQVLPDTKNVTVIIGTSPLEQFWRKEFAREIEPLKGRIAVNWTDTLSFADILKQAAALPPHSAIFWGQMVVDAAGVVHEGGTALANLHAVANAPIFSYDESFFGREIVGGPLLSIAETSQQTAAVGIRILGGEKPADIHIPPVEFAAPIFDWRQMQRWNIAESRLPPGSEIRFRVPTVWERYRLQVSVVLALIFLQTALILWLLYEQGQRSRSEADARELSRRLINAQEEERARLARELHDDVTQRLAALAIDAARHERADAGGNGDTMQSVHHGLVRLSEDVHALSYRLHPSILTDLGLVEALRSECDNYSQSLPHLEFSAPDIPDNVPQDIALCLYRVAQESLRNVARHASASRTEVDLRCPDFGLQLTVRDNGVGFDTAHPRAGMSLGLASMRERVISLGGSLDIESSPGHGTTVQAWIPLPDTVTGSVNAEAADR